VPGGPVTCDVVLLGAAHIHVRGLAPVVRSLGGVRIVSVWDHDPVRAARWASALDADVDPDVEAALDAGASRGALVYSETSRHRALVSAAARRGLPVFVEKPLAVREADAVAIAEVLRGDEPFSTGFFLRYADAFTRLRDMVADGDAGQIRRASVSVVHGGLVDRWFDGDHAWMRERAEGGGGFFDLVVHCLDLTAWVLGPIEQVLDVRVQASGHHGTAVVRTASGTVVDLEAGWEAPVPAMHMSVTGDAATLTATGGRLLVGSTVVVSGQPPDAGDAPRAWIEALAERSAGPLVSIDEAVDRVRDVDLVRHWA
jgi:predicted dehydrogenase